MENKQSSQTKKSHSTRLIITDGTHGRGFKNKNTNEAAERRLYNQAQLISLYV